MQGEISTLGVEIVAVRTLLETHIEENKAVKKRWYDNFDKVWIGAVGAFIGIGLDALKTRFGWK